MIIEGLCNMLNRLSAFTHPDYAMLVDPPSLRVKRVGIFYCKKVFV
jgi:hypothetical protein